MSAVNVTSDEVLESLTGFDEKAIGKWFDDIESLTDHGGGSMFGRALVFIVMRRDGATDADAHNAAMSLTLREVNDFFADEDDESGKDDEPLPEPQPEDSPDSA